MAPMVPWKTDAGYCLRICSFGPVGRKSVSCSNDISYVESLVAIKTGSVQPRGLRGYALFPPKYNLETAKLLNDDPVELRWT